MGFGDICLDLGAAIGLIPLIAILEQVAIAKAFGRQNLQSNFRNLSWSNQNILSRS